MKKCNFILGLFLIATMTMAQNVGIGTPAPTEPLEVTGIIYTNQGGVKFPDGSIQTSAAYNSTTADASENRQFIIMEIQTTGGASIPGPYNGDGFTNAVKVIQWELGSNREVNVGGGGATVAAPQQGLITFTKEIDIASVPLQQTYFNGTMVDIDFHIMTLDNMNNLVEYYTVSMERARIIGLNNRVSYKGNGAYAHLEELSLYASKVIYTDGIASFSHTY